MYNTIVFDFDGVIVNGISLHDEAYIKTFGSLDIEVDINHLHTKIGMTVKEVITSVLSDFNVNYDVESLVKMHNEILIGLYESKSEPPEGLKSFVENCKKAGLKIGVASSTPSNILKMVLSKYDLHHNFEVFIGGEMINKGKPDPEMIQKALDFMGIESSKAIAIDDARSGIIAAKKINMYTIAYLEHSKKEIEEADINVYRFRDIKLEDILK